MIIPVPYFNCYVLGIACVPHILFIPPYFKEGSTLLYPPPVLLGFPGNHSFITISINRHSAHVVSLQLHYMG